MLEERKRCVSDHLKTYLDERKVDNLQSAATYADEYALTHKTSFRQGNSPVSQLNSGKYKSCPNDQAARKFQSPSNSYSTNELAEPMCYYCKKHGHVMSDCRKRIENMASPNALAFSLPSHVNRSPGTVEKVLIKPDFEVDFIRKEFRPFVSEGSVSLTDANSVPIKILRDTGATQSLLLKGLLPLNADTATGEEVIIQGIEGGLMNVPLHRVQ